jgi:hypothetical protein
LQQMKLNRPLIVFLTVTLIFVTGCARQNLSFSVVDEKSLPPAVAHWSKVTPEKPTALVLRVEDEMYMMVAVGKCPPNQGTLKIERVALEGRGKFWVKATLDSNPGRESPRAYLRLPWNGLRAEILLQLADSPAFVLRRQSPNEGEQLYQSESKNPCGT